MFMQPCSYVTGGAAHMLFCLLISVLFVVRAFMEVVAKNSVNGDLSFDHSWPQILIAINYDKVWSPCDGVERVCLMAEEVVTNSFFLFEERRYFGSKII